MGRFDNLYLEEAYEDNTLPADLGASAAVPTTAAPIVSEPAPSPVAQTPVGIAALPGATQADPGYGNLTKQITDYWSQLKINPMIQDFNRAEELARLLHAQGITEYDPTKFRIKETKIMDPSYTRETESGSEVIPEQERILKQLMYGDKAFGRLGGYGSKGEFDTRTEEYLGADDSLARSYAGKGFVDFVPVQDKQGNVIIVPKWGSSSDIDPMMMQIIGLGLNFALPGLGLGLGTVGNAALAGGITGLLGSEGDIIAGLKSAALSALGAGGAQYLTPGVSSFVSDLGLTGLPADIATKGLTAGGVNAARAALTGDSIGSAFGSGFGAGAAGAAASGAVNELGLPADIGKFANPVLTAALLGQDPTQALVNSLMSEATKAAGSKSLIPGGGTDVIPGFFEEGGEGWLAGIEQDLQPTTTPLSKGSEDIDDLLNELYIDTASKQDQVEPTGTEVEDIERLVSEEQTQPSSYTDITDLLGAEEPSEKTVPTQVTQELPSELMVPADVELDRKNADITPEETQREIDSLLARYEEPQTQTGTPISAREREAFLQANVPDQDELISLLGQDEWDEETNRLIQQTGGLKEEDFEVTQDGTIRSTYSGEEGRFDPDTGEFVPYTPEELGKIRSDLRDASEARREAGVEKKPETKATAPKAAAPGATTPKTAAPSPKTAPAAQSQRDIFALMAAMGMMGDDDEEQAQAQQLFDAGVNVKDIFRQYYG